MVVIKNFKTTRADQNYFETKGKIKQAAEAGKLGKDWFTVNPKTGKRELRPKRIYGKV